MTITISKEAIWISIWITLAIMVIHQFYLRQKRKYQPYEDDRIANASIFYFRMIVRDYVKSYQTIDIEGRERFFGQCLLLSKILDYRIMMDVEFRNYIRPLLHNHHESLMKCFGLFLHLEHTKEPEMKDMKKALKTAHQTIDLLCVDVLNRFLGEELIEENIVERETKKSA